MYKMSLLLLSMIILFYPQNELLAKKHKKEHHKDRKEKRSCKHRDKHKHCHEHSHKHRSCHSHSREVRIRAERINDIGDPLDSWDWYNWTHGTGMYSQENSQPEQCEN